MASFRFYTILEVLLIINRVVTAIEEDDIIKKNDCENPNKMDLNCIMEVFTSIFKVGNVMDKCCAELIVLGKVCHAALVKRTLQLPQFKNLEEPKVIAKSIQIWNNCALVANDVSPSVSP